MYINTIYIHLLKNINYNYRRNEVTIKLHIYTENSE